MTNPIYFVRADFGRFGTAFVERAPEDCDRASTLRLLRSGEWDRPVQVLEVDLAAGSVRDVTAELLESC